MPDRVVRQGILTSDQVNELSWAAEVFYRRLFSRADDYGRYDARPSILRADLYALKLDRVSESDVVKWMGECSEAGLIRVYTVNDKPYLEILKFDQRLRAMKSKYPAPIEASKQSPPSADICCQAPAIDSNRQHSPSDVDECSRKRKETETETESETETEGEEKRPPPPIDFSNASVIYDIESELLNNQIIFEQICMGAGRDLETGKYVLAKYHLSLQENEKYPRARPALIAGFKKWLITENSTNGKKNAGNATHKQVAATGHTGL